MRPVAKSHPSWKVRSVLLPFWLNGMTPAGRAAPPEELELEDVVAVGFFLSLPPASRTTAPMTAITATIAMIGP
jgi:hypothetical protein